MSSSVALVTGASSGIGLALTKHLLSKGWNVVLADVNPPPSSTNLPSDKTLFIKCDVSSWDQQASLFAQAFDWHKRLDFCALNAGIDDRDDIFHCIDASMPPKKPNMLTFDVDLYAVYYGCKLAAHYFARNPPGPDGKPAGGDIVMTASAAGLYPHHAIPQYSAAKAALVALTRTLAPQAIKLNIGVHALCPAMVPTNLAPPGLMEGYKGEITPMSTIMRSYDAFLKPEDDGRRKSGKICLASGEKLIWVDEELKGQRGASEELGNMEIWERVYVERNVKFATGKL